MRVLNFEEYIKDFDDYLEEVKRETPDESKRKLISMGILDNDGNLK